MAVETARPPARAMDDPHIGMGMTLAAKARRARLVQTIKITLVWMVLITLITFLLLQLRFEPAYLLAHYGFVLQGAATTIGVSLASISIATVLALLGALGRLSKNAIAQGISGLYVSIIRGTPLLIQIYLIYLGLPQIGQQISRLGSPDIGRMFILTAI